MRWQRFVTMVEAHAEGEVGRVVTGGLPAIPGSTPAEKMRHLNEVDDSLRRFLVFEPRGAAQMSTNILVPKSIPEADAAYIILQGDRAHAMSGSNTICVATVLLETGMVPMTEPETHARHRDAGRARPRPRAVPRRQVRAGVPRNDAGLRADPRRQRRGTRARPGQASTSPMAAASTA